jgi:hypothetical membrane protein
MSHAPRSGSRSWTVPLTRQQRHLIGGLLWTLSLVFFAGQAIAQSAWPSFSSLDNHVSDLGNTACGPWMASAYVCSPLHAVMNAALILSGLLMGLGLYLTRDLWPSRRLSSWGLGFLALTGLCTVLVGLNPENVNLRLHMLGALNIPFGNLALLLLGLATWRTRRRVAMLSLALGAIGWLGLPIGLVLLTLSGHGGGAAERLALYPVFVWTIVLGVGFVYGALQEATRAARTAGAHRGLGVTSGGSRSHRASCRCPAADLVSRRAGGAMVGPSAAPAETTAGTARRPDAGAGYRE